MTGTRERRHDFGLLDGIRAVRARESAAVMRKTGVDHVLVATAPYPADIAELLRLAKGGPDFQRIATVGSDYLFKALPR